MSPLEIKEALNLALAQLPDECYPQTPHETRCAELMFFAGIQLGMKALQTSIEQVFPKEGK